MNSNRLDHRDDGNPEHLFKFLTPLTLSVEKIMNLPGFK